MFGGGGGSSAYELQSEGARRTNSKLLDDFMLPDEDCDTKSKVTRINTYGGINPALHEDSAIVCCENCNHRRRTIILERNIATATSWGFTLQSYGVRDKESSATEVYTYVDYVEYGSAAFDGGLRKGDVIIALNGKPMQGQPDEAMVACIRESTTSIRMVVVSGDICSKVDLHARLQKLKEVLAFKEQEVALLEERERRITKCIKQCTATNNAAMTSL